LIEDLAKALEPLGIFISICEADKQSRITKILFLMKQLRVALAEMKKKARTPSVKVFCDTAIFVEFVINLRIMKE